MENEKPNKELTHIQSLIFISRFCDTIEDFIKCIEDNISSSIKLSTLGDENEVNAFLSTIAIDIQEGFAIIEEAPSILHFNLKQLPNEEDTMEADRILENLCETKALFEPNISQFKIVVNTSRYDLLKYMDDDKIILYFFKYDIEMEKKDWDNVKEIIGLNSDNLIDFGYSNELGLYNPNLIEVDTSHLILESEFNFNKKYYSFKTDMNKENYLFKKISKIEYKTLCEKYNQPKTNLYENN